MTSRQFFALMWIVLIFFLQQAVGSLFPPVNAPLMLAGVIYYALTEGPVTGALIGCVAGFLIDSLGVGKLGASMTMYALTGVIAGFSSTKIFYDSLFTQALLPAVGHYLICLVNLLIVNSVLPGETGGLEVIRLAFFASQPWSTIIASIAVFSFLKKVSAPRHSRPIVWKTL